VPASAAPPVLPVSVSGGCINSRSRSVTVRLPSRSSLFQGFSASSYLRISLRLAGELADPAGL